MQNDEIKEKLIYINRITKVVKGGRRFAFSALVVAGNQSGKLVIWLLTWKAVQQLKLK